MERIETPDKYYKKVYKQRCIKFSDFGHAREHEYLKQSYVFLFKINIMSNIWHAPYPD